jgi:hypothetical protein
MNIKWYHKKSTAEEVYAGGLQYTLISKDYEQSFPFIFCKDFLHDAVWCYLNKAKCDIFGFVYDYYDNPPICTEKAKVLIGNESDFDMGAKINACIDFVHQFEDVLNIEQSKIIECSNPPKQFLKSGVFLFEGDHRWISSPPMLSLYSLMIRIGFSHEIGLNYQETMRRIHDREISPYQENDRSQIRWTKKGFERIIKVGDKNIFYEDIKNNYAPSATMMQMHDDCGFAGFAQEVTKEIVPFWHREQ